MKHRASRRGLGRYLLPFAVLFSLACASTRSQTVDFSGADKQYSSDDYLTVHERWTRHARLVQDVGTVMEYWATFKSWDFRQAFHRNFQDPASRRFPIERMRSFQVGWVAFQSDAVALGFGVLPICVPPFS